jgi:hypothetical protein
VSPKKSQMGKYFQGGSSYNMEKSGQTQMQSISCSLRGHSFSFVYCRATPTIQESEWLFKKTADTHYVLGDLNLDPNVSEQLNKIHIICGPEKMSLLNEVTTKNKRQLDHILGPKGDGVAIFTTSFTNFVSDHKSTTMRISLSGAHFVEDPRLPMTEEKMDTQDTYPSKDHHMKMDV